MLWLSYFLFRVLVGPVLVLVLVALILVLVLVCPVLVNITAVLCMVQANNQLALHYACSRSGPGMNQIVQQILRWSSKDCRLLPDNVLYFVF